MTRYLAIVLLALGTPGLLPGQARRPARTTAPAATRLPPKVWSSVAAGSGYTCALDNTGQAFCWGENLNQKLGIADSVNIRRPAQVETPQRFVAITTGTYDTCALTREGAAVCWGGAPNGSLPHSALGDLRLRQLDYSQGACGVAYDNIAWCWGPNGHGQLGSGRASTTAGSAPERVAGTRRWQQVVTGTAHACGLTTEGAAFCWGKAGQLGTGATANADAPVAVPGGHVFMQLAAGSEHTCGIARAEIRPNAGVGGAAWCWGTNTNGALGTGQNADAGVPALVAGNLAFKAIAAGYAYTCALTAAGRAYCWGWNQHGVLGTDNARNAMSPTSTSGTTAFASLSGGSNHVCAVTLAGALYCWGDNADGALGIARGSSCRTPSAAGRTDARPCATWPSRVQEPR